MLRDSAAGMEVFLLERHGLSEVLGGAYVFPGGKVDREDLELASRLDLAPADLPEALGEPSLETAHAAAVYVAAIREAFEEAGVLFAALPVEAARTALEQHRAGRPFNEIVSGVAGSLAASSLQPWSRWVTPLASVRARKHFDARFFLATVPAGQQAAHDQRETTASIWLAPAAALREYWEGRIQLAAPQIMSLSHLARFPDVAAALADARTRRPPRIQPEAFEEDGVPMVCYPGDPRHSVPTRMLPGPGRLRWRNDRYEPEGGLEALLG
jgi:8-oxo-dGTP pyrophosphatase MutT (NUDIX family)